MGRTKETELPSLRIYLGRQNTLDGNSAVKPVRETEKNSNQSSVESVSAEKLTAVCGESNDVPACSGKRKRFELLDDELKEFKNLCKEKSSTKNRYLWSKVLNEIDEFKAGVLSRIEFHNSCMPILAEFFLKDENSIDKEELKRMNLENERLKKDHTALGEAMKAINTMNFESSSFPEKLTKKLCPVTNPVVGELILKIFEYNQTVQEIETNRHLQWKRKEILEKKVKAFKGIDDAILDIAPLRKKKEISRLVVLQLKQRILSSYRENEQPN